MPRSWPFWLTVLLTSATLGWFWLLSADLHFYRSESSPKSPAPPAAATSGDVKAAR